MNKGKKSATKKGIKETDNLLLQGALLADDEKIGEVVNLFKKELKDNPGIPVILDLCDLENIYSKGVGVILGLYKECKAQKRPFTITVHSDDIYSLFQMFKLDKALTIQKVSQ
jgi:anti-anti-sigma factor